MNKHTISTLMSSSRTDWGTPDALFKWADNIWHFDIDVAANARNKKCARYWSSADNALKRPWSRRAWCNPPYGREVGAWVEKAILETGESNQATCAVLLLPARTDTRWFRLCHHYATEIIFLSGRLTFKGAPSPAPFPSMLAVFKHTEVGHHVQELHYSLLRRDEWTGDQFGPESGPCAGAESPSSAMPTTSGSADRSTPTPTSP